MPANDNQALLLQISADLSKLQKKFAQDGVAIVNAGSDAMERRAKRAAENIEHSFGKIEVGKALNKVFDSARLATLEEGGAKLRVFGSALEPLGPLGLAAAAGIAALGIGLEEAHKAVEFADNLFKLAKNAHVTTDELQQFQFALRASGGNAADASTALQAFSTKLGQAQAGLPRAQRAFKELGFSKEQIKGFDDAGQALIDVTARIEKLKSPAQKDAVIEQLGLEQMKPLIEGGVEKMREFMAEAQAAGQVMDASLIKRGRELNEELEKQHQIIDVQLKEAFIQLGPILVDLAKTLAQMATFAREVADALSSIGNRSGQGLLDRKAELQSTVTRLGVRELGGSKLSAPEQQALIRAQTELAQVNFELDRRTADNKPATLPNGGASLIDQSKGSHKAAPRDDTAERTDQVNATLASSAKALLDAQKGLTEDIEKRAQIERDIAAEELKAEVARIQKQEDQIAGDKGISQSTKDRLTAELELAKINAQKAADAKVDLINREADWAAEDAADDVRKRLRDFEISRLEAVAAQATTEADRTRIEADILKLKQDELIHERNKALSRGVETGKISQPDADALKAASEVDLAAQRQRFADDHASPLHKYLKSIQDLDTEFENAGVTAAQNLATGLADAIVNAQNLGDVAKNVFRQMVADLLAAAIKRDIEAPLLAAFGFASGGSVMGPGSGTSDSIPAMLSNGEYVINAKEAAKHRALLDAINRGGLNGYAAGGIVLPNVSALQNLSSVSLNRGPAPVSVFQAVTYELKGSVLTEDLLKQMAIMNRQAESRAVAAATTIASKSAPGRLRDFDLLGT
jgi:hypothetical protein